MGDTWEREPPPVGDHHRIELPFALRVIFSFLGFGGLILIVVQSYRLYSRTGSTERDLWFYLHLPAYVVYACVCIGLLIASVSSGAWHSFARVLPPPAPPDEDPWGED